MAETKLERLEYRLCFLMMGLIPLHLYLSFSNLLNGIDKGYGHSYPLRSYVLIGVYLLIVLVVDLFMIRYRKFELSKVLCWYWSSAFIAVAFVLFLYFAMPEAADIFKALCLLYSPFVVLNPLLEFLRIAADGVSSSISLIVVGGFCLFNWAICKYFVK